MADPAAVGRESQQSRCQSICACAFVRASSCPRRQTDSSALSIAAARRGRSRCPGRNCPSRGVETGQDSVAYPLLDRAKRQALDSVIATESVRRSRRRKSDCNRWRGVGVAALQRSGCQSA
eukprot:364133-Chlamydomonas_euryale.AAC.11